MLVVMSCDAWAWIFRVLLAGWLPTRFYERRRNFLILKDLRNKNNVIDYLEQKGNVVSFTVEVNPDFTTTIVGVSNSCQRLCVIPSTPASTSTTTTTHQC